MPKEEQKYISDTIKEERGKLLGFIKKRVPVPEDAEDILQDVFYQLVRAYQSIGSIDRVASWLYKVANNKIIDRSRKSMPIPIESIIPKMDEHEALTLEDILPDFGNSTEDHLLQEFIWQQIGEALKQMPKEQAEVFVLHELEDKSFKEISEQTGIPQNTLFSRKRYAILFLREKLKEIYKEL
jgi:RNA polymerase sigma factor (sigma-70 family)